MKPMPAQLRIPVSPQSPERGTRKTEVRMKSRMSIDQRLRELAAWLEDPELELGLGQSIFGRIRDEGHGAATASPGLRPDVIDGVSCRPDGGMSRLCERLGRQIARDSRCRELYDLVRYLPRHHLEILRVTYLGPETRSVRACAELLNVSSLRYRERKAALLAWFEGAMYRAGDVVE
jgi:hypothetical protein